MKVLLDTYSFHFASDVWKPQAGESRDIFWILEKAREFGFNGIHAADMRHFNNEITVDAVIGQCRGLEVSLGTGGSDPDHMKEMIDLCSRLGHSVFRTFIGKGITEEKIDNLKSAAEFAEKKGVVIAVENHQDLKAEELLTVIQEADCRGLGICLDTGNALGVGEDPVYTVRKLAPHIYTTHIKDYAVKQKDNGYVFWSVPVGSGSCSVHEQLDIVFAESPLGKEVPLNCESALEYIDVSGSGWGEVLQGLPKSQDKLPLDIEEWSDEKILREEEGLIKASLENLKEMLSIHM
jgi:sugar phosphate isomerase/epimerase